MREILDRITYKEGYHFETSQPEDTDIDLGGMLRVIMYAACTRSGKEEWQRGRWFVVKNSTDVTEVVRTAYQALYLFELHELQEQFKFDGKIVFDPHTMNLPDNVNG